MYCPACNYEDTRVIDSRLVEDGKAVRRRRECLKCGHRFTTYERLNEKPLIVIKKDKSSEPFDSSKILRGLMTATAKRNVPINVLQDLIADIENELRSSSRSEVTSTMLGDMVLERLRDVDELAYIRFASVYKDFKSIDEFADAIKGLN
ncbi:MAG: transcriptional regulator NrdR [Coriobacteriales bacterium]|jgi:transcriptional repressor NrdR